METPSSFSSPLSLAVVMAHAEVGWGHATFSAAHDLPAEIAVERAPSATEAIGAASAQAAAGRRASVVLDASQLIDACAALRATAAARVPLVVHVVVAPGGRVVGHDDLALALDLGAGVLVSWSGQDAADIALVARRAAEDSETPFVHIVDVPTLNGSVQLPTESMARQFLGAPPDGSRGGHTADLVALKRAERSFAARVPFALTSAMRQLGEITTRQLGMIERYETADAEEMVVTMGCAFPAAEQAVMALRGKGRRIGLVGLRSLRPFLAVDAVKALGRARAIVVIEPMDIALAPCGPVAACVKSAFADALTWAPGFPGIGRLPPLVSANFATIDGAITELDILTSLAELASGERARRLLVFGSDG